MDSTLSLQIIAFALAWWLGLYLLGRDPANPQLRYSGLGLVVYALGVAGDWLGQVMATPAVARWTWPLLFLPALFWLGALVYLLPEDNPLRLRLGRWSGWGLLTAALIVYAVGAGAKFIVVIAAEGAAQPGPGYWLFAGGLLVLLLAAFLPAVQSLGRQPRRPVGAILAATLFFGLGMGLLLFPLEWLPRRWIVLGVGGDLVLLGLAVAALDAFDQGEALLPDFGRSLAASVVAALLFGGQVGLVMATVTGVTTPMLVLLLATVATAIATQALSDPIQAGLDRLVFARLTRLRQRRADLRTAASALPRLDETVTPAALDEAEMARLTRRALSHLGHLPRLTSSPLTRLPIIEARLARRGARDDTLERAAELKALLTESILRLKPRQVGEFGATDEWRYYNALYFPYVVGLKPYSRRTDHDHLEPAAQAALAWFQTQVPERTLHNWQRTAAELIARDLLEQG